MGSGQCTAVIGEETAAAGRDQRHLRQAGGPPGGETGGAGGAGAGAGQGKLDRLESQQAGLQTDLACPLARQPLEVPALRYHTDSLVLSTVCRTVLTSLLGWIWYHGATAGSNFWMLMNR